MNKQRLWIVLLTALVSFACSTALPAAGPCHDTCLPRRLFEPSGALSVAPVYTGELFSNTRGGITTKDATRYQALLDIGLTLDFKELGSPIPGKFFLLAQNTHGRGLTRDFVGDTQVLSNIDSFENIMQVSEYWWQFGLLDDDIIFRLGKQDVNTEFLFIEAAENFVQSSFGLSPSTAFPTYPDPSMGAVMLVQLNESWRLKAGVWDAFSKGSSWGFSGNDSILVVAEAERSYALAGGSLPGIFAIGAVYESAGEIEGQPVSSVQEYVIQVEQMVYREHPVYRDDHQGMAIFGGYYPRFPGNQLVDESIGDSLVAGITYTGLFAGRDEDQLGVGVAWAELFRGGTKQETVTEVFYKTQLTPRMSLQPDLQYISSPSGIYRDALVVGVRFQLTM